ncbi:MAG TPA: hypothetical protein VJ817_08870 [Gemmatimonadales bacterium]|nr:hypothetical protein [Gemmatimonadales bacterium]
MIQVPTPQAPLPPLPPAGPDPSFLIERLTETVAILLVVVLMAVVAVKVLGPLARAWARKLEGKVGDPELRAEVDHLRDQLAEMDGLGSRVQELEERVEFAERMLSRKRDEDLLQRGGGL